MTMTDPIADFLTRVRNAINASHEEVTMPYSKGKAEISRVLKEQGYIDGFSVSPAAQGQTLTLRLRYTEDRRPAIAGLKRISTPGRRVYVATDKIPRVQGGMGTTILTTSIGVMTGHEAKRRGVGGELLAEIR